MSTKAEEVPLSKAFALLADEEYCDVSLQGTDGGKIRANRMALSVRSPYFKTMFKKGAFKEADKDVVPIGFSSFVLKAIVEYVHTDTASILAEIVVIDNGAVSSSKISAEVMEKFQALLSLTEAAIYVDLPNLWEKAQNCLESLLRAYPCFGISILAASKHGGPVISGELKNQACRSIGLSKSGAFNEDVLGGINGSLLAAILRDDGVTLGDGVRFKLIVGWSKSEPSILGGGTKEDRQKAAKNLVQNHIELEFIDPDDLSSLVATSGLVTTEQLCNAFQRQAKRAKHKHKVAFGRTGLRGYSYAWKCAKSITMTASRGDPWSFDTLECQPLTKGKFQWTITLDSSGRSENRATWLGVAETSANPSSREFGGTQKGCWGVHGCYGGAWSNGALKPVAYFGPTAKFGAGATVTVILDLSVGNLSNGSLSISVNGLPFIEAVCNLKATLKGSTGGLVPAVSTTVGSATIVDYEEV
ncbi:expressed unknown protein [Seminavis robusta]|uniref:BTB domain-containing protein n=1 Tax=Seminavis robusta TaxID=568900 RepID=A0A9N8DPK8_9STRA|nr:expressed unknown protein [Seminavis robusta]|eukprot:Sro170_g075431.1  (473) ;mRNA; f:48558-49976